MGLSGAGKKDNNVKSATKNAVAAAQPKTYSDPFGTLKNGVFTPNESETQKNTRDTINAKLNEIVNQAPTEVDVTDYYDNPFYETTRQLLRSPVEQEQERARKELTDRLNARGQTGGSYDALARRYQDQDFAKRFDMSEQQARLTSADAYQQNYQNIMNLYQALGQEQTAAQQRLYEPARMGIAYQQAVAPLQSAQVSAYSNLANYFAQRPTLTDRIYQGVGAYNDFIRANAAVVDAVIPG